MFFMPALCKAAADGDIEMTEKLLTSGANVDSKTKGGMTALMLSALFGHKIIFKILLKYGANYEVQNEAGFKAFDYVDLRRVLNSSEPFYDINFSQNEKMTKTQYAAPKSQYATNQSNLLFRRKKSLPKLMVQQSSYTIDEMGEGCFAKRNSAHLRYSPYMINKSNTNKNSSLQVLSPNVANFFGNILQMQYPGASQKTSINKCEYSTITPKIPIVSPMYNKPVTTLCPNLRKVLNDHGCDYLLPIFEYHEVNYQVFCSLTERDLMQIGVKNICHRNLLLQIIKKQHLVY